MIACQSSPPPVELDVSAAGWQVRQGQAIWKPGADKPEITGDVVLATHPSQETLVQFSKTLPILSARITGHGWTFEAPAEKQRHSGRGEGPNRLVWLQLLRAWEGREISDRWSVAHPSAQYIALEDQFRGERLEVFFQGEVAPRP